MRLDSGLESAFPPDLVEGLAGVSPETPARIEVSVSGLGLGLHWPTLMQGVFGSRQ